MANRRPRGRQLMLCVALLLTAPVGLAHLAQNAVPGTMAGQIERLTLAQTWLDVTDATLEGADDDLRFRGMEASLTTSGSVPVSGVPVTFMVGDRDVCAGVLTDDRGTAVCDASANPSRAGRNLSSHYVVAFSGRGTYRPATASGRLTSHLFSSPPAKDERSDAPAQGGDHAKSVTEGDKNESRTDSPGDVAFPSGGDTPIPGGGSDLLVHEDASVGTDQPTPDP